MKNNADITWINPIGGLGDTLMVSGVLKLLYDLSPDTGFNLIRRTMYTKLLSGHPAVKSIGHPPGDSRIIGTDYWMKEELGGGNGRPMQVLARAFGMKTPVEEKLYVPGNTEPDPVLESAIPWKKRNVLMAPGSDSPRKTMKMENWEKLTEKLTAENTLVVQAGRDDERLVAGAYSLLGQTTPRELISLLKRFDLIITSDNFIMHASHAHEKAALVLWGPTLPEIYGYPEQVHLKSPSKCGMLEHCLGPRNSSNYAAPCPVEEEHCINRIPLDEIMQSAVSLLKQV